MSVGIISHKNYMRSITILIAMQIKLLALKQPTRTRYYGLNIGLP
jgi:hypothetical protein